MRDWKDFGGRLRWAVRQSGLGNEAIGEALGTAATRLSEWTAKDPAKRKEPSLGFLQKLPGVLGVNGHWLITGEGSPLGATSDAELRLEAIRRLVDPRRPLPDEDALFSLLDELPDISTEGHRDAS